MRHSCRKCRRTQEGILVGKDYNNEGCHVLVWADDIVRILDSNIVKGSGYISSQCCGSTEIELGIVYDFVSA